MTPSICRSARLACLSLLTSLLVACGGGDEASQPTPTQATASGDSAPRAKFIQSTTVNAEGPATTLTVRAHGTLAGNVGPLMTVLVDGVQIDIVEVRATTPTDYRFTVPALRAGSKVDIAFTNDATINGADRNLFVNQLTAGDTYMLPTAPGVLLDRGAGAAAFDGIDVLAGQMGLFGNSALRITWPEPNMTERLTVRASGALAGNVGPVMALRVDGVTVGSTEVRSIEPTDHTFAVPPLKTSSRVDVVYLNHETIAGTDRSLRVDYLIAGTTVLLPNASGVTYDLGNGLAAFDGINVQPGQASMTANGALRGKWPAPNMTDTLTVRASGRTAVNVGPIMQVRVDGVVLGSVEVRATTPTDHAFPTLPLKPGSQVDVVYTNDITVGGEDRDLTVAYLIAGKTYLLPTSDGVVLDQGSAGAAFDGLNLLPGTNNLAVNGALRSAWPAPNLTDILIVRAKGNLAGNVGPTMQVLVDGVMLTSTEVRNTDFADFNIPAPAMGPGRKVDIVFTNDAMVDGADRNLFVAYLIAGNTFVVPDATNSSFDRGTGAAAFDGSGTVAGSTNLFSNGALRTTWAQPNITDTLTVRASGTLAGNVGPIMNVRVDGVLVSSIEVRSAALADYKMAVPPLRPGSRVDLVFTNDAVVGGIDRNLQVGYAMAGSTFVLPTSTQVLYDLGQGNAAFDGLDTLPGQSAVGLNGALRFAWPSANVTDSIMVRASATLAGGIGALMQLRVDGVIVGTQEVRSVTKADYFFAAPRLQQGSRIDVAFINDEAIGGQDRNLFVQYVHAQGSTLVPIAPTVVLDAGAGEAAFDGNNITAGSSTLFSNSALRFTMPAPALPSAIQAGRHAASRFLQQATFGPTLAEVDRLAAMPLTTWLNEQMAIPAAPDYVNNIQAWFNQGPDYRPNGARYTPTWVSQRFWATAAGSPDALRKRVAFALHQIFMVSQVDSNLYHHARAYAAYLDVLNKHAFGNFRTLLEDVALSPAMGIYLSHMRNRPEDAPSGRMPDENFAREVMQLFTIGLHELNIDGTPRLDGQGQPVETYTNDDVMAMAKVFTGWSWAAPDAELTESVFRWGWPDYAAANDQRIDTLNMKAYPGQHSSAEKRLFAGRPHAMTIVANTGAHESLRLALNALFNHPNVGPFIGRQLIQRMVTSHPSAAYVARVATVFNNNGRGVRGDMAAVVRAVLLDAEATAPPAGSTGKLREPVVRLAHWMRSFGATSASGHYMLSSELDNQSQRALYAPSVFGYFRPGYVPPNTGFAGTGTTVPELQIVNESTTAQWVNMAQAMAGSGLGWAGSARDVTADLKPLADMAAAGSIDKLIEHLNLLLYAGRMSATLKQELLEAMTTVAGNDTASHLNRARVAVFLALASPEYMVQR